MTMTGLNGTVIIKMQEVNKSDEIPEYVECPLYKKTIGIGACIDVQEVAARHIKERILPNEIREIKGFRSICLNCENNLDKKYER